MSDEIVKDMIEKCIKNIEGFSSCIQNLDTLLEKLDESEREYYEKRLETTLLQFMQLATTIYQ